LYDPHLPLIPPQYPSTPEVSHSASTSTASSVSPQKPPDAHGPGFVKVVSADSSPVEAPVIPHNHGSTSTLVKLTEAVASASLTLSAVAPKKPKTSDDDCTWPICICDVARHCVWYTVITLTLPVLYFSFFLHVSFHHLNGYLCSALSVFFLFAAPHSLDNMANLLYNIYVFTVSLTLASNTSIEEACSSINTLALHITHFPSF